MDLTTTSGLSIGLLGALMLAGLLGPILRIPRRWGTPVAVGELLVGIMLGKSWLNKIPTTDSTLKLLSAAGFALLMFSAGSHIDYRAFTKRAFATVYKIILANTVVAIAVGLVIDQITHFSNWRLIATLSFSSSAGD